MVATNRELAESMVAALKAPKAHAPRMEVPFFYGEMDKAVKWLNQYNAVCAANRWDEPSKLAGLCKALRDRAATWFEAQYRNLLPVTYDTFTTDFKEEFISSDYIRTAKERFFSCTQKPDETPLAYLTRLRWLRTEIEQWVSEADLLGRAQSGLLPKYWALGLGLEKSLSRFSEKARALEVRESLMAVATPPVSRAPPRREEAPKSAGGPKTTRPIPAVQPPAQTTVGASAPSDAQARHAEAIAKRLCFYCRKSDHFLKDCPTRPERKGDYPSNRPAEYRKPDDPPVIPEPGAARLEQQSGIGGPPRYRNWRREQRRLRRRRRDRVTTDDGRGSDTASGSDDDRSDVSAARPKEFAAGRIYHPAVIGRRVYRWLVDTGGARSLIPLELAMWHKLRITPIKTAITTMDGRISPAVLGEVVGCPVSIGASTLKVPLLVVDGAPAPVLGHDILASMGVMIDTVSRKLIRPDRGIHGDIARYQVPRGDDWPVEAPSFKPYPVRTTVAEVRDAYYYGRIQPIPRYTTHAKAAARRAIVRDRPASTVSHAEPASAVPRSSHTVPSPAQTTSGSETTPLSLSPSASDGPRDPDMWRQLSKRGRRSGLRNTRFPQPQPEGERRPEMAAYTTTQTRLPASCVTQVKLALPKEANGNYLIKLNPGYTDLDIVLPEGLVAGRAAHVWVAVVNKSAEDLLFDRQLPFAILEAFDDEVLDLLEGTEPNISRSAASNATQCAAFTDSDETRYTDEEARSLADATPEDFARWRQVAQTFTFGEHLDDRQVCRLGRFLEVHRQQFAYPGDKIGFIRGHEHRIDTGDNPPVARPPYRISGGEKKIIEDEVRKMLKAGVIVPIQSAWASPVVLVNKRDGSVRFCVDYRALNSITKPDLFPLPRIDDCLDVLGGNDTFTTMDACSAYWQVPMAEDSIHKTAMVTHMGHYAWKFMPFGLRNAPATMSRVVEQLYEGYNRSICMVYLDDTITFSQGFDEHLDRLGLLFARMKTFGLKLKPEKCAFARSSVSFLGHLITAEGIAPDPDRVRSIAELTPPTTVTGVRAFLGFTGFYRRFIRGYANIARPLFDLTVKGRAFAWGPAQQRAFEQLRDAVLKPDVCAHFDPTADLILRTDASTLGIGATLNQVPTGRPEREAKLVACYSRTLRGSERNYSTNHLECLAINESIKNFRPYLWCKKFTVQTDHRPCCALIKSRDRKTRQGELALELNEHLFEPVYKQGKYHLDADFLSRHPARNAEARRDEDLLATRAVGIATFNIARPDGRGRPTAHGSNVASSPVGVPRMTTIARATTDEDAASAADGGPPHAWVDEAELTREQRVDEQWGPIWRELHECASIGGATVPSELATTYRLTGDRLYRRICAGGDEHWALCVPKKLALDVLAAHHDTPTGCHYGIWKTYDTLRRKYHWSGMKQMVKEYVRTCKPCQLMKPSHQARAGLYQPLEVPEEAWSHIAMDTIGPIHPRSTSGNAYILTVIDLLSKHAFAAAIPDITTDTVMTTLRDQYLLRYPLPQQLLTDRGTSLMARAAKEFYALYGVKHVATSGYNPETNGSVEHLNGVITTGLAIQNYQEGDVTNADWDRFLREVVYSYNATTHVSSGYSPSELAFGVTARRPVDNHLGWVGPRVPEDPVVDRLDRAEQRRINARARLTAAQNTNKTRVDRHRRDTTYNVGDRVLLYRPGRRTQRGGKLKPRYMGPAIVVECRGGVNYRISSDKHPKPRLVHARYLKPFHVRQGLEGDHITTEADTDFTSDSASDASSENSETEEYFGPAEERAVLGKRPVRTPTYLRDFTQ